MELRQSEPCVITRKGQRNDKTVNMKIPALRNIRLDKCNLKI